jgi:uncharacterized protein YdeI (YjbR/CyaY-like superfamily)
MKTRYFKTDSDWENWLEQNHQEETELWLVYYKKHTGKTCISYDDSVKTALCYGWIDGLVKRLDDECYTRRFTPRKKNSMWSESNKKRVAELMKAGRMKPAGLKLVEAAKQNGNWDKGIVPPKTDLTLPEDFEAALNKHPQAARFFAALPKSHQKEYLIWIKMAKRTETKQKRIQESIRLLRSKQKLGLK